MTKKRHWLIFALALGLVAGLFVGCSDDDDDDDSNKLSVELEWATNVDVDLLVEEPTGQVAGLGTNGPTLTSSGNNICGFGTFCETSDCLGLTCDTREAAYTTSPTLGGTYTVSVENNGAIDESVAVFVTVEQSWVDVGFPYYMRLDCTVPTGVEAIIATAEFSASNRASISGDSAAVTCTVTEQSLR